MYCMKNILWIMFNYLKKLVGNLYLAIFILINILFRSANNQIDHESKSNILC
jgi:hypothetical protein